MKRLIWNLIADALLHLDCQQSGNTLSFVTLDAAFHLRASPTASFWTLEEASVELLSSGDGAVAGAGEDCMAVPESAMAA